MNLFDNPKQVKTFYVKDTNAVFEIRYYDNGDGEHFTTFIIRTTHASAPQLKLNLSSAISSGLLREIADSIDHDLYVLNKEGEGNEFV